MNKKFILGSGYRMQSQGTKTSVYLYSIIEVEMCLSEVKELAVRLWGDEGWAIEWTEWREQVEIKNENAHRVFLSHDKTHRQ